MKNQGKQTDDQSSGLYLAIDQGGNSSRAMLFSATGKLIVKFQQHIDVNYIKQDWVEQDPVQLRDSVMHVVQEAVRHVADSNTNILGAGLATQRSNVVCWNNQTGEALSPALSWQDRRAYKWINQFSGYNERVRDITGLLISPHYGASKLKWCLDNIADVMSAYQAGELAYGPLASYLVWHLVNNHNHVVDPANASRTLLWNMDTCHWDQELLTLFDIPEDPLPVCVASSHAFGDIAVAGQNIPLRLVTGDQSAAFFAYGEPAQSTAYINMGTGAFIQVSTGDTRRVIPGLLSSMVYLSGQYRHYVVECTVNGASNALMQMEDELNIPQIHAQNMFTSWLQETSNPPLYLNGVAGLGAPFWVPNFESRFVGDGTPEEKLVAVAESILFLINVNLEQLMQNGIGLDSLVLSGGLSENDALCQKLANLSGMPVFRPIEVEATAKGLAFLLARDKGMWQESHEGKQFRVKNEPQLKNRYLRWRELMTEAVERYK